MKLDEFKKRLKELKKRGYIETVRKGNTGVGRTLEQSIGLKENNLSGPDLEEVELKSQRRGVSNRITIFTFNRGAWKIKQSELIERYGYVDTTGRKALYCTASNEPNPQGLYLSIIGDKLGLFHRDGCHVAEWDLNDLMDTFAEKVPNLVVVIADSRTNSRAREEFAFNEAYYLQGINLDAFLRFIQKGLIIVDIRMHLKKSGGVRNHGTAFRTEEKYLSDCFKHKESLLK